jgi:hypothetical protein
MLNFVYLRSSRLKVLYFWLDSCIANKGEKFELENGLMDAFRKFWGGFEPFLGSSVHRSDRSRSPVWPVRVLVLCTCWAPVWPVVVTGLTGGGDRSDRWELSCCSCLVSSGVLHAFVQGELHWFRRSLHVCRWSSLWFFELWFGGLCSLLELCFVSNVSSRCPCLRGPKLVFFKWSCSLPLSGFRSLVGVSFCLFLFVIFSLLLL